MFKHGVGGTYTASQPSFPPSGVGTIPVYIGTAPVNVLASPAAAVNTPILVSSFANAQESVGYSEDWESFTLCEAIYAHFKNTIQPIGPIVLINVLDPADHIAEASTTKEFTFPSTGIYYLDDEEVDLPSLTLTVESVAVTNVTYSYVYKDGRNQVKITDLNTTKITTAVTATYKKVTPSTVDANDVIGSNISGVRKGLECVDLIYQTSGYIPTILVAPGWSHDSEVYAAMVAKSVDINSHWDTDVYVDIDSSSSGAGTKAEAITWKETNAYTSKLAKVFWPMSILGERVFHISTLCAVRKQQTDYENDNIPHETPSNKQIPIVGTVLEEKDSDSVNLVIQFDEAEANELNAEGITTAAYIGGRWVLWGDSNANYSYTGEENILPEDMFDCTISMQHYLKNTFQKTFMPDVDRPFNKRAIERILDRAQIWLNGLVSGGYLLGAEIAFRDAENSTADMAAGRFVFKTLYTSVPAGRYCEFDIEYTADGLDTLLEE